MADEQARRQAVGHTSLRRSFASGSLWLLCGVFFMNTVVTYGIFLWLPKLLQDVSGATGFTLSTITSVPFVAALVAMVVVGRHSDRTGERRLHVAACAVTSAAGLLLAVAVAGHAMAARRAASRSRRWRSGRSSASSGRCRRSSSAGPPRPPASRSSTRLATSADSSARRSSGALYDVTGSYTGGLLALTGALVIEAALVLALKLPEPAASRHEGLASTTRL